MNNYYCQFLGILFVSRELQDKKRLLNKIAKIYEDYQIKAQNELDEYLEKNGIQRHMGMIEKSIKK